MGRVEKYAFWKNHIEGWRHSGISQARYCEQHDLSQPSFSYWSKRLKEHAALIRSPVCFVKANLPDCSLSERAPSLYGQGWRLDIPMGIAVDWLSGLLRELG